MKPPRPSLSARNIKAVIRHPHLLLPYLRGSESVDLERKLISAEVRKLQGIVKGKRRETGEKSGPISVWKGIWKYLINRRIRLDVHFEPASPIPYLLVRLFKPRVVLETEGKFGFSSTFILEGLVRNGGGILVSIDWPNAVYPVGTSNDESAGYVDDSLPPGFETGCIIPNHLRARWRLIEGKTQIHLPTVMKKLGAIDLFFRDSEHAYEAMQFEFQHAYAHLAPKGILVFR